MSKKKRDGKKDRWKMETWTRWRAATGKVTLLWRFYRDMTSKATVVTNTDAHIKVSSSESKRQSRGWNERKKRRRE